MKRPERFLQIYGPSFLHSAVFLVGTKEALESLRASIDQALEREDGTGMHMDGFATEVEETYNVAVIEVTEDEIEKLEPAYNRQDTLPKFEGRKHPGELWRERVES